MDRRAPRAAVRLSKRLTIPRLNAADRAGIYKLREGLPTKRRERERLVSKGLATSNTGSRAILTALGNFAAQAIEARRAETGTGSVHESAVGNADAPKGELSS